MFFLPLPQFGQRLPDHIHDLEGLPPPEPEQLAGVEWGDGESGYDPRDLQIVRFGLNFDFITAQNYTWIDNLITGSGKNLADPNHRNYKLPYVQRYLDTIGERKCEANVLVTTPDIARNLCRNVIEGILGTDARDRFVVKRHKVRERYEQLLTETGLTAALRTVVDSEDEDDGGFV